MAAAMQLVTLITIRNMDRAIKFYTKALGAKMGERADGPMKNFWASVHFGKQEVWLITPQKWEKRSLAYSTFVVKNIKATVKKLTANGVKFQKAEKMSKESRIEGSVTYEPFGASAFFKDPEGNVLMLWQNNPDMM